MNILKQTTCASCIKFEKVIVIRNSGFKIENLSEKVSIKILGAAIEVTEFALSESSERNKKIYIFHVKLSLKPSQSITKQRFIK
jgi:hypothetical protein